MSINSEREITYGDDDKCIKTRIKTYKNSIITNFYNKAGFKEVLEEKIPQNVYQ